MSIVEKEAIKYSRELEHVVANLSNLKSRLSEKLYSFNKEKDKLYFLRVLEGSIKEKKVEHEKHCIGCGKSDDYDTILYAIEQEHYDIEKYYMPDEVKDDAFTSEEKFDLHNKINEILNNLSYLRTGQEVIFNEIDVLKEHFNLGKKSWFQLLKIKLIDACMSTVIEKSVAEEIYNGLSEEVGNVASYIEQTIT